jgi:5-methylcytosine-specific restriction endonuclease McrA
MSNQKKLIRQSFRDACYKRDNYKCVTCEFKSSKEMAEQELDAHHITDRTEMPNGGYVKENGISLCEKCHQKAEHYHSTGVALPGFSIEELYKKIGSSPEKARSSANKLK